MRGKLTPKHHSMFGVHLLQLVPFSETPCLLAATLKTCVRIRGTVMVTIFEPCQVLLNGCLAKQPRDGNNTETMEDHNTAKPWTGLTLVF